jgi:phosphomannomutase
VEVRRGDRDPYFGGASPDPVPDRLVSLGREVRRAKGLRLGLATDGDADRFGVIDADGRPLSESDALALLVDHLARTGRIRRGVAISIATGSKRSNAPTDAAPAAESRLRPTSERAGGSPPFAAPCRPKWMEPG